MKGGKAKNRQGKEVCLLTPGHGITDHPWARNWLAARRKLGLSATLDKGMQPNLTPDLQPRPGTLITAERATKLIRQFVEEYVHITMDKQ